MGDAGGKEGREMLTPEKIMFRGPVQKNAVPCGFGECKVKIAECEMGWWRRAIFGQSENVDSQVGKPALHGRRFFRARFGFIIHLAA